MSDLRSSLKAQREELVAAVTQIRTLATTDDLTSLPNRRFMSELLHTEERRRQADSSLACLALIDIDLFKKINDRYGHDAGDAVLRQFAQRAKSVLRDGDVMARWGGEEFLVYLPQTDLACGLKVLERLLQRIQSQAFEFQDKAIEASFSAGLVQLHPGEFVEAGLRRADELLYEAKDQGRSRIVTQLCLQSIHRDRLAEPLDIGNVSVR